MDDLINRQAAISICDNAIDLWNGQLGTGALVAVRDAIMALPSAQPEHKKGKWLRSGSCIFPYECDQCEDANERATPFCPNCGAKMER